MAPYEIRDATLSTLRTVRAAMASNPYLASLAEEDDTMRRHSAFMQLNVQHAIRVFEELDVRQIRPGLVALESDLVGGLEGLQAAAGQPEDAPQLIAVLGGYLASLGRVVGQLV